MDIEKELEEWLSTRPPFIQEVARKYPPNLQYRIKEGAPYALTCAGSIVGIVSYRQNGTVTVGLLAANKLPETLEREKEMANYYNKDIAEMHASDISAAIDPQWLEPLNPGE